MQLIRQIYQDAPNVINMPEHLQHRRVEVIIRLLDDEAAVAKPETDANGWPLGFFAETAGAWAGEPIERAPQGDYEQRIALE